eukprot:7197368-Alexandrium_andersonii.AAC.1
MSASLVGSEMCIRDSQFVGPPNLTRRSLCRAAQYPCSTSGSTTPQTMYTSRAQIVRLCEQVSSGQHRKTPAKMQAALLNVFEVHLFERAGEGV